MFSAVGTKGGAMGKQYEISKPTFWAFVVTSLLITLLVGLLCGLLPDRNTNCFPEEQRGSSPEPSSSTPRGPTNEPEMWENIRLPTNLKPHLYDLSLEIDITNEVFNGVSEALIECVEATNIILIHSKQLNIDFNSITLTKQDGGTVPGFSKDPWLYPENQYLVIELDGNLKAGSMYELSIGFDAELKNDLVGLYRSTYKTEDGQTKSIATTFFAPTDARKAFPCFDEPAFKANFTLTIDHEPGYIALANMPLDGPNTTLPSGWVRTKFEMSVPMSTYLLCFVVCDFIFVEKETQGGVQFRVWARPEARNSVEFALEKGADIIDFFEDYFQIDFPLPKMDMIAIPDFTAGAMENWGLITYRETALLYTEGVSSPRNKQRVCTVVSHELAHQWFGNLVTLLWWDDTWLNEGFASYVEYLGVDYVENTWGVTEQFVVLDVQPVMTIDALQTSRPIIVDVETPDDINQQFDAISYNKGASILRMLQNFMGETAFKSGLNNYLEAFAYSNAANTDLWEYLEEASKEDGTNLEIAQIMNTWTLQMGFPVITVTRSYGAAVTFSAAQHRFLSNPDSEPQTTYPDLGYKWHVPLTYTTLASTKFDDNEIDWLIPDDEDFERNLGEGDDATWLLVNIRQYGYYRVNYDQKNWQLLSDQLIDDHTIFPESNRATLISDAFNLARGGELSQVQAFELTSYLVEERDYVPWVAVDSNLGYVDKMLSRSKAYGDFNQYMLQQVTPFYDFIGWEGSSTDHLDSLSHSLAVNLACSYGKEDCVNNAIQEFAEWMSHPENNTVNPTLKSTVYCTAISKGGQAEWEFAYNQYKATLDASEASTLLSSLGCSKEVWVLSTFLELTLDGDEVRAQDAVDAVTYVARNPVGYSLAWDFFRAEWEFFRTTYGDSIFQFSDLIEGVTSHFNTEFELQMLEDFIDEHPDQGTGSRAFTQAVDNTKSNIRWINSYLDEVATWLDGALTD